MTDNTTLRDALNYHDYITPEDLKTQRAYEGAMCLTITEAFAETERVMRAACQPGGRLTVALAFLERARWNAWQAV